MWQLNVWLYSGKQSGYEMRDMTRRLRRTKGETSFLIHVILEAITYPHNTKILEIKIIL